MTTLPQTTSIQLPRPMGPGSITPSANVPAQPLAAPPQMTGSDVWRVIRSHQLLIITSLIGSLLFGFALNSYLMSYYPRYTAIGLIEIQSGRKLSAGGQGEGFDDPRSDAGSLVVEQRTQSQLLQTDTLRSKVLQNANAAIRKTDWFSQFKGSGGSWDIPEAKEDMAKHFSAVPIADSKLISISFTCPNPKDCRTVVEDMVNQHIDDQRTSSQNRLLERKSYYQAMVDRYRANTNSLRNDTVAAVARLQLDGTGRPGGVGQNEQRLLLLVSEKLKADGNYALAEASYEIARKQLQDGGIPARVEMMINQDPFVMQHRSALDSYDIQCQAILDSQGELSRTYRQAKAYRDFTAKKLEETRDEKRVIYTDMVMGQLDSELKGSKANVEQIATQMDKIRSDMADMTAVLADYLSKKDSLEIAEDFRRRMQDQLDTINTAMTNLDMNSVAWSARPETPDSPSFPKWQWTLALCGALGLGLSLGFCFLREAMDTSVRSPRDIARVGQMNLLGMIPHEDDDPQAAGVPLATVIFGAPTSIMAEQFRQVRTRLQHAASLDTTRSILVTSPSPGDGKTTVATNLAAGLALNGRRILLVDANFRRAELHKIFETSNDIGFGNVLGSIENFESAVRQTKVPNLDMMTTGPRPTNATELLESQLLIDFIERALEEYDHVIFDSGPMLVVSETVALAPRVDGVVTVVRARANSRGLLQRMRDGLRQIKAEHLGVVLNGVRSQAGGYYNRNIKTYYEYQNGHAG